MGRTLFDFVIPILDQERSAQGKASASIRNFCPALIARDRAWYHMMEQCTSHLESRGWVCWLNDDHTGTVVVWHLSGNFTGDGLDLTISSITSFFSFFLGSCTFRPTRCAKALSIAFRFHLLSMMSSTRWEYWHTSMSSDVAVWVVIRRGSMRQKCEGIREVVALLMLNRHTLLEHATRGRWTLVSASEIHAALMVSRQGMRSKKVIYCKGRNFRRRKISYFSIPNLLHGIYFRTLKSKKKKQVKTARDDRMACKPGGRKFGMESNFVHFSIKRKLRNLIPYENFFFYGGWIIGDRSALAYK